MALFCLPLATRGQGRLQPALRQATGQREAVQRFLKWILGETSPTIYVSFWKKKRENLRGPKTGPALIFACNGQTDLCAYSRRWQRRTILAAESPGSTEAAASPGLQKNSPRGNRGAPRRIGFPRTHSNPDEHGARGGGS